MAFIFADSVGDFGHQLQARRSELARNINQAANDSARYAFAAQQARQAQADQKARGYLAALQGLQSMRGQERQFQFNRALANDAQRAGILRARQATEAARYAAEADKFAAAQRLEAERLRAQQEAQQEAARQAADRRAAALKLAQLGRLSSTQDAPALYQGALGLSEADAAVMALLDDAFRRDAENARGRELYEKAADLVLRLEGPEAATPERIREVWRVLAGSESARRGPVRVSVGSRNPFGPAEIDAL